MLDLTLIRQRNEERKRRKESQCFALRAAYESPGQFIHTHGVISAIENDDAPKDIDSLIAEIERLRNLEAIQGTPAELKQDVIDANERTAKALNAYATAQAEIKRIKRDYGIL